MKALLMHRDRDFDPAQELPWNEAVLTQDLALEVLLSAMAGNDRFVLDVARSALLAGMPNDVDTILYRQDALKDGLKNPAVIRELYDLTVNAVEMTKKRWMWRMPSSDPSLMLYGSIELLDLLLEMLGKLWEITREHAGSFASDAFTTLFAMLSRELSTDYLGSLQHHLRELQFRSGVFLSAKLGERNEGIDYVLGRNQRKKQGWLQRILGQGTPGYTFRLDPRDEAGATILSGIRSRGISRVAVALTQSADHVLSFFAMLQTELAFYVGCLNLHQRLTAKGEPVCFPLPAPAGQLRRHFRGLYDPSLSLLMERRVVGNDLDAEGKSVVVITGANQGGKSIFLRSIGLAQLMMQCGMFVGAEFFEGGLCTGLFTHYKREEDATMKAGKFDEELARISAIADHLTPDALLLCNESFAATNEREGSEIAGQIVCALLESSVQVFFVTHLYEFAHDLLPQKRGDAIFLRAQREAEGLRTFKIIAGEPLETSYGEDLYRALFPVRTEEQD